MVVWFFQRNLTTIYVWFLCFLTSTLSITNQHTSSTSTTTTCQNKERIDKVSNPTFGIDNNLSIHSNDNVVFVHDKQQSLHDMKHVIDTAQYYDYHPKQQGPEENDVKMYYE